MKKVKVTGHNKSKGGKSIKVKPHRRTIKGSVISSKSGKELAKRKGMLSYSPKDSTLVHGVKYDPVNQEMHVTFFNGRKYKYRGVPEKHFTGLQTAKSAGSYFHKHIRTSYEYKET